MAFRNNPIIRSVVLDDYNKGFLTLLQQLSNSEHNCTIKEFEQKLKEFNDEVWVVEINGKIVGTGKVFIENKFGNSVGHIEDIIIDKNSRKQGIGSMLVKYLTSFAKVKGCYKVVLGCSSTNVDFYKSNDFVDEGAVMVYRFF